MNGASPYEKAQAAEGIVSRGSMCYLQESLTSSASVMTLEHISCIIDGRGSWSPCQKASCVQGCVLPLPPALLHAEHMPGRE